MTALAYLCYCLVPVAVFGVLMFLVLQVIANAPV